MGTFTLTESGINGRLAFALEQAQAPAWVRRIMGPILSSQQETEKYRFAGMSPALRQWVAERLAVRLREYSQNTANVKYEATLEVYGEERKWDRTGQVDLRILGLSRRAASHWGKLATDLIEANGNAYDAAAFFADAHSIGDSGSLDNNLSAAIVAAASPTAAEMEDAILTAIAQFFTFKDDRGEPVNEDETRFLVMVPPKYWKAAAAAINAPVIVDGSASRTNIIVEGVGSFEVTLVVNPRLTAASNIFYVFIDGPAGMPALYRQADIPAESDSDTADVVISSLVEGSDHFFRTDNYLFGVKAYRAVDYGDFCKAIKFTFTTAA